jgi:hypothetical protein
MHFIHPSWCWRRWAYFQAPLPLYVSVDHRCSVRLLLQQCKCLQCSCLHPALVATAMLQPFAATQPCACLYISGINGRRCSPRLVSQCSETVHLFFYLLMILNWVCTVFFRAGAPPGFYYSSASGGSAVACTDGTYQDSYTSTPASACTSCPSDTQSYSPRTSASDCCK